MIMVHEFDLSEIEEVVSVLTGSIMGEGDEEDEEDVEDIVDDEDEEEDIE
jgi:hypothetical protein